MIGKRLVPGAIAIGLLAAAAPVAPAAPRPPAGEREILAAERSWMDAMKKRDRRALDSIMAPEFTLGGLGEPERAPLPRAVWIDNAVNHLRVESVSFDRSRATILGNAATVNAVFTWRGSYDGEAFTDTVTLVDVWVRRNGRWQVASRLVEAFHPPD